MQLCVGVIVTCEVHVVPMDYHSFRVRHHVVVGAIDDTHDAAIHNGVVAAVYHDEFTLYLIMGALDKVTN